MKLEYCSQGKKKKQEAYSLVVVVLFFFSPSQSMILNKGKVAVEFQPFN